MENLLFFAQKPKIIDYGGGANSILMYLFFGGVLFSLFLGLFFYIYKQVRRAKFHSLLGRAGITGEELGILKSFLNRFNVKEPIDIVENRSSFNRFIDRVAHHYEYTRLSEEAMIREMQIFDRIRRKLGFFDILKNNKCKNTRELPLDQNLIATFTDTNTHESFSFQTRLLANYDFFLGIEPPEKDLNKELFENKRPPVQVAFDIEGGAHHTFDTRYLRTVNYPETILCLQHSNNLTTTEIEHPLDIPVHLMIAGDADCNEVCEIDGTVVDLSNKDCCIVAEKKQEKLGVGTGLLISFNVGEESFTCRGSVADCQQMDSVNQYRMSFAGLNEEEQKLLVHFAHEQKKLAKTESK